MCYLQDFTEFLHDVSHRAAAWPVDLHKDGAQFLDCLGSGPQLLAGHARLLQHLKPGMHRLQNTV